MKGYTVLEIEIPERSEEQKALDKANTILYFLKESKGLDMRQKQNFWTVLTSRGNEMLMYGPMPEDEDV